MASLGFVQAYASETRRGSQKSSKCSRRQFLVASTLCLSSTALPNYALESEASSSELASLTIDTLEDVQSRSSSDSVSLNTFVEDVGNHSVKQAWFFGNFNQYCFYERKDGSIFRIVEGYPTEVSRSPESPLHVMAQLRNR